MAHKILTVVHALSRHSDPYLHFRVRNLVQVAIYRRLRIGRDGNLDQSEAYDIS